MKKFPMLGLTALCTLALLPLSAMADGRELATKKIQELNTLAPSAVATGDTLPVYDSSAREVKKVSATAFPADVSGQTFGTTLTGNPLLKMANGSLTLAQANAGYTILSSATGKTIYPTGGFTLMASGTAAGATGVYFRCGGSQNVIASFAVGGLVTNTPVGPFKSTGTVLGSALTRGCASGDTVFISTTGTLTTSTHLYYSFPYTVQ